MTAIGINADLNAVSVETTQDDLVGADKGWDVVLAGDVFYDATMADRITPWLQKLHCRGASVLIGDPQRHYIPVAMLEKVQTYEVPVSRALEDSEVKKTIVWRLRGGN